MYLCKSPRYPDENSMLFHLIVASTLLLPGGGECGMIESERMEEYHKRCVVVVVCSLEEMGHYYSIVICYQREENICHHVDPLLSRHGPPPLERAYKDS